MPRFVTKTATIAAGQSLSSAIDCSTGAPVIIHLPLDWQPSRVSFQISPDGGANWYDLFERNAAELEFNVVAGTAVVLERTWTPVTQFKLRSGGRDAPVVQDADRTIVVTIDTSPP
jgi:hypothetical protein